MRKTDEEKEDGGSDTHLVFEALLELWKRAGGLLWYAATPGKKETG